MVDLDEHGKRILPSKNAEEEDEGDNFFEDEEERAVVSEQGARQQGRPLLYGQSLQVCAMFHIFPLLIYIIYIYMYIYVCVRHD